MTARLSAGRGKSPLLLKTSTTNTSVLAIGLLKGIRLRGSGRLSIPVWLSTSRAFAHCPIRCATTFRDDAGDTWQRGELALAVAPNLHESGAGVMRRPISRQPV